MIHGPGLQAEGQRGCHAAALRVGGHELGVHGAAALQARRGRRASAPWSLLGRPPGSSSRTGRCRLTMRLSSKLPPRSTMKRESFVDEPRPICADRGEHCMMGHAAQRKPARSNGVKVVTVRTDAACRPPREPSGRTARLSHSQHRSRTTGLADQRRGQHASSDRHRSRRRHRRRARLRVRRPRLVVQRGRTTAQGPRHQARTRACSELTDPLGQFRPDAAGAAGQSNAGQRRRLAGVAARRPLHAAQRCPRPDGRPRCAPPWASTARRWPT